MLVSVTNPLPPALKSTNPQDRTPRDLDNSNKNNHSATSHLIAQVDAYLANNQLDQAKQFINSQPELQSYRHYQLFKIELKKILTADQPHRLNNSSFLTEDLRASQKDIVQKALRLRKNKYPNRELTTFMTSKLESLIRGEFIPSDDVQQLFSMHPSLRKVMESLKIIQLMLGPDENNKKIRLDKYFGEQSITIRNLRLMVESLQRQNQVLLNKQMNAKLKIKEAKMQYTEELVKIIKLKQELNLAKDNHRREIQQLIQQFSKERKEINRLFDKSTNNSIVYAHIGATIKDMKQIILKQNNQNKLLNQERQLLNSKLDFIQQELQKQPNNRNCNDQELIYLRQTVAAQNLNIRELQSKIQQIQHSCFKDSRSVSSSSLGMEDSRGKKISRTNPRDLVKEIKKKDEEISKLQAENQKQQQKIQQLQSKLKESITFDLYDSLTLSESTTSLMNIEASTTNNIRISKSLLQKLDDTNKRKEEQIQRLNAAIEQYKLEIDILKGQPTEDKISELEVKMALLQQDYSEVQNKRAELELQNNHLKTKNAAQCRQLRQKITSIERKLKTKDQQVKTEKEAIKALNYLIENLKQSHSYQLEAERNQKQALKKEVASLQAYIKALEQNSKKSQTDFEHAIVEMKEKEQQLLDRLKKAQQHCISARETQANENIKSQLKIKSEQYNQLLVEYDVLSGQNNELIEKLKSIEKILEFTKLKQKESESKCAMAQKKLKTIISDQQFRKNYPEYQINHLFHGDILEEAPESKVYLKQLIQNKYNSTVFRTKLIYKWDPLNKINFHQYIDNKDYLLVIVELANGGLIAGYYHGRIYPKMVADKDTLLVSITNRQVYELLQINKRGITYDEYFFIMGNSELRLKFGDKKFFSNFGTNNGYFRNRGNKIIALTGTSDRELEFNNVEFYQIFYL